ncbi:MAG: hypothetical protein WC683_08055 [bacterium]
MAEEITGAVPQAGTPAQPQAGNVTAATTPAVTATTAASETAETLSIEEAKKLRQESQSLRKRLKELEDAANKAQDANLTEVQRAQKQAQEASARAEEFAKQLRDERGRTAITDAAIKLGVDVELARSLVKVEFDEEGKPLSDAYKLLEAALKKWPQLKGAPQPTPTGINAGEGRGEAKPNPKDKDEELKQRFNLRR